MSIVPSWKLVKSVMRSMCRLLFQPELSIDGNIRAGYLRRDSRCVIAVEDLSVLIWPTAMPLKFRTWRSQGLFLPATGQFTVIREDKNGVRRRVTQFVQR